VDNLRPQIESICYGAITATRAVLPAMLAAGTGTLLYTTGGSSVTPAPVFVSAGMAGAGLRKWALTLNGALAGGGVYAGHVAIGTWIAGTPGAPKASRSGNPTTSHASTGTSTPAASLPNTSSPPDPAVHMAPMTVPRQAARKTPARIIASTGTGKAQPEEQDTSLRSDSVWWLGDELALDRHRRVSLACLPGGARGAR
jgi:hypothetical protein